MLTQLRELPARTPLTAILSSEAISSAFRSLAQQVDSGNLPSDPARAIQQATRQTDRKLLAQEITFYHGLGAKIRADYQRIGFLPALEADVRSRKVFGEGVETVDQAIEARIGLFWQRMMYHTPQGIGRLKPELTANHQRLMTKGATAGVIMDGQPTFDKRAIETIVTLHHMTTRVESMLKKAGFDTSILSGTKIISV